MIEQEIILRKEECDWILDSAGEYVRSGITRDGNLVEIDEIRTSYEYTFVDNEQLYALLFPKLKKFGIKSLPSNITVIRYNPGHEFKYHVDNGVNLNYRIKSVSIQLSDEYDGGEMVVWGYDGDVLFNKEIGNLIIFNSELPHQAFPVKSGTRYALVFWLREENLI